MMTKIENFPVYLPGGGRVNINTQLEISKCLHSTSKSFTLSPESVVITMGEKGFNLNSQIVAAGGCLDTRIRLKFILFDKNEHQRNFVGKFSLRNHSAKSFRLR